MAVIAAFKDGWTALLDNPVLLLAGFCYAVASQVPTLSEAVGTPLASGVASLGWFLLVPFLLGGLIGLALEAVRGTEPSFDRFLRAGRTYYGRLLGAAILFVVIVLGVVLGVTMPWFVVGVGLLGLSSASEGLAIGVFLLVVLGYLLSLLVVLMFVQFYNAAIVVDDESAVSAFSRSVGLVRRNLLAVAGYSILWTGLLNVFTLPEHLLTGLGGGIDHVPTIEPILSPLAALPVGVLLGTVAFAYLYTVHTAFYLRLAGDQSPGPNGAAD